MEFGGFEKKREKLETNLLLKTLNAHQCNLILPRENLWMSKYSIKMHNITKVKWFGLQHFSVVHKAYC